ncbi:MAG: hypothetical protein P1V35_05240 [Planctomycetota bacterium]|nr:hypothetical protein [Planctomycetota bacterium]
MRILFLLLLALSFAGLPACSSPGTPKGQFESLVEELRKSQGVQGTSAKTRKSLEKRYSKIESWAEKGKLETAEDNLWAAACLIHAESPERIALSLELARKAAQAGESRALPLIAQAMDKQALQAGRPQPYGTQYLFHTDPGIWVLYDIDPKITDGERAGMGLPPLAELYANVKTLNVEHRQRLMDAMMEQ